MAVTLAAEYNMFKHLNAQRGQVWSVPAGHGKSRIIIGLVAQLHLNHAGHNFLVVYNHDELMQQDLPRIKQLEATCHELEIKAMVATRGCYIPIRSFMQVTIIDEVDSVIFDQGCVLVEHYNRTPTRAPKIVGLTATADN